MPKLESEHPVKIWILSQKKQSKPTSKNQEKIDLLNSVVNSQFNLITDLKMKEAVIDLIAENSSSTNLEKLINSYLYLLIGNTTHSDNILKELIQRPPKDFYRGFGSGQSIFHQIAKDNIEKILNKFSRHPSDRLIFHLFASYLRSFSNQTDLLDYIDVIDLNEMKEKLDLAYTAKVAPEFIGYLRLEDMKEKGRMELLRSGKYSFEMQSLWVWSFLDVDPLISDHMIETLRSLDEKDPLWTVYILSNEKISDMYFKKGGLPVSRRRQFLRQHLENQNDFMLTLYKLIEIGDIDQELVRQVSQFMIHE